MASNISGGPQGVQTTRRPVATGWTYFAAAMMIFGGVMAIFEGIAAIARNDLVVVTRHYSFSFSTTGWGWVHLVLGVLIVVAGVAVLSGALWARAVGVALAGLALLANFLWLPYYPFWAIVLIAVDVLIIWALCAGTTRDMGDI